mgnify:CR=1 FL=1
MNINQKKKFAAGLSITSNVILTVLKIAAGILSGSLSIISEAIHSLSDFLASILTFFSVVKSSEPADKDHPYGHGKYEDLAGFIEGILIIFAAFFIVYESIKKITLHAPIETQNTIGICVMALAVISNIIVSTILFKVSRESNSISLYADGEHLRTDVYSSLGVLGGLILIQTTHLTILDPIIAILVAFLIYKAGVKLSKRALMRLLDYSLPEDDIKEIKKIIESYKSIATLKKDSIKARQTGPNKDIDLILQFPCKTSICDCHKICDEIEKKILELYSNCSISIHFEPVCYENDCQNCSKESYKQVSKI